MKTLNLIEAGIAPGDILNKKAQKHILGGERWECCYCEHEKDQWDITAWQPCNDVPDCINKMGSHGLYRCYGIPPCP